MFFEMRFREAITSRNGPQPLRHSSLPLSPLCPAPFAVHGRYGALSHRERPSISDSARRLSTPRFNGASND